MFNISVIPVFVHVGGGVESRFVSVGVCIMHTCACVCVSFKQVNVWLKLFWASVSHLKEKQTAKLFWEQPMSKPFSDSCANLPSR